MGPRVDLRVDRNLLDSQFDGYKLSLDRLPVYPLNLNKGVDFAKLDDNQFSYLHSKLYGSYNHIFCDPWNNSTVYIIDTEWTIQQVTSTTSENTVHAIYTIPKNQSSTVGRYNVSLTFPSPQYAVISDGVGQIYILYTENRQSQAEWKVLYKEAILESVKFHISDSIYHQKDNYHYVECLLTHIEEVEDTFTVVVDWITLQSVDGQKWTFHRKRTIKDPEPEKKAPNMNGRILDYAVFEKSGEAVLLASDKIMKLVSDSEKNVENGATTSATDAADTDTQDTNISDIKYTWSQTEEDVTAIFSVPEGTTKTDITFTLDSENIQLGVRSGEDLLVGKLYAIVDVEASTWTIANNRLELTLGKRQAETWPLVVEGDNSGQMTFDPEQIERIHNRLQALTSDQLNPDPCTDNPPYNSQELEECDLESGMTLLRIDGETHQLTHQIQTSDQWLFTATVDTDRPTAICLRHDVDGCVWQPQLPVTTGQSPWKHIETFNAMGYVQASKQQRKYSACPPNCKFCVVCDCTRHLYIYHRNCQISSPLRNRKTGQQISSVAKQQVISLESTEEIMGLHTANERIFVLTQSTMFVIKINPDL